VRLQAIDSDDLNAHYFLATLYRSLGIMGKAKEEATLFTDERDDPSAHTSAQEFLDKHPGLSPERLPWHLHMLTKKRSGGETASNHMH